jgi:cobalt-zinc-cadmium efflux system membrane fusion protein
MIPRLDIRRGAGTAAALLAAVLLSACGDKPAPAAAAAAVDPMAIEAAPDLVARLKLGEPFVAEVRETLRVPGRIEVDETRLARIGSPVTGRITELEAAVGQNVRRGDVLAGINSTELSSAQLGFLKAMSQRQLAERAAGRAQQLYDADVIGQAELQRRQSELVQADAELSAARDQMKVLGMSERAIQRLQDTRTVNSLTQIVSGISGTVIERKVTPGQVVQPADSVYLVADLTKVWLVADIPEQISGLVQVGEAVDAEVAALPGRVLKGTLTFVSVTVSPETRTVRVRMDLPNPEREYKPAMLATVLVKGKPTRQLVVPAAAVVREDNRDHVFVQTGSGPGSFLLRQVSLGGEYEGKRVVVSGLREGEPIVIDGAFHLNNERKRRELQAPGGSPSGKAATGGKK